MTKWIWLFFLPFTASAQNAVLDPNGLLPALRRFVATPPFESAFHCGDVAKLNVFIYSCTYQQDPDGVIESACKGPAASNGELETQAVYNCIPGQVSILTDLTGDSSDISKDQFSAVSGDMAELFLAQAAAMVGYDRADVTLTGLTPATFTLARGTPQERTVQAMNLSGTLGPPGGTQLELLVTVLRNASGIAQIARFRLDSTTWFMLDDWKERE